MKKRKKPGLKGAIKAYIFSDNLPLEERLLNAIYFILLFFALSTGIFKFVSGNNRYSIVIYSILVGFALLMMGISNHYGKFPVFRWFVLAVICDLLFPYTFFAFGGPGESITGIFIFSIVLVFFLLRGKGRVIFLIIHAAIIILCFYVSTLSSFVQFVPNYGGANRYIDSICTLMMVGLSIGLMISFQNRNFLYEKEKLGAAGKNLEQSNKLYKVVTEAAEILLSSETDDINSTLYRAMELMARCVDVDRMYIWRNRLINGKPCYEQVYEWLSGNGSDTSLISKSGRSYIDAIPEWNQLFLEGKYINGSLSTLADFEKAIISPYGICSLLGMPIFIHDNFWGLVSFEDCINERIFSEDEVSILRSGCLLMANAIVRNQNNVTIEARLRQQAIMAEISRSFITKESPNQLIYPALKKTGEFLGASRVYLAILDENFDERKPAYSWVSSGEWNPPPVHKGLGKILKSSFLNETIPGAGYITAISCNDINNEFQGKYKFLSAIDIKSFIWAPVYVDNFLWGIISVENCISHQTWGESDIQLVGTVSSSIAGAIARDLIDQARTAALEQAVQASQAKGNFLANMSHEMRTPMNAIIGMTSIGKNSESMEKKDYAFDKIENASSHLLGVINDILDISKIEANKLELSAVSFDFEMMLQRVVNVVAFRVDERNQELTVHIDDRIPRMLLGDDIRLAQVITNLLSNAIKFTSSGGSIHLDSRLVSEEDNLCTIQIEICDSGIGISSEQQVKLFNSFEQAESGTARKFGGTGLGLAISKRIVELMGGKIWIESELGKGATFAFTIKVKRDFGTHAGKLNVDINNVRVLAVDDSPEILEHFGSIMTRLGIDCDVASGAGEAMNMIENNENYDFYFIDWKMPETNGIELTRRIRQNARAGLGSEKPVVVIMSATEWSIIEKEAREAGVDKFLPKPLFPSAVASIINESLESQDDKKTFNTEGDKNIDDYSDFTILLAEDVEINREIILTILAPTALNIECAENGMIAYEKFAAAPEKYSMIFMDIQMPEMDGYEATRKIREINNRWAVSVPIVAMTANVFREDIEKCFESGMNDHIGKPLDLDEVLRKLKKYLPNA